MKTIVVVIVLLGFAMLPANHRLMDSDDDDDYLAVATSIAYGKFPYFADEFHVGQHMPFASVGPGLLASPFVLAFSLVDRFEGAPVALKRERDNRYWTWTLLGFHFAVYLYFLLGAALLYEALKLWAGSFASSIATLAIVLGGGGLLIYVFLRPVMSHVFEFFVVSAAVSLISLALKGRRLAFHAEFVGFCAALIFLTRYNNAFLAVGVVALFFWIRWKQERALSARNVIRVLVPFIVSILVFRVAPVLANGYSDFDQGYAGAISRLWPVLDPLFYWIRLGQIVLDADMGLLYTAPVFLLAVGALWRYRNYLPKEVLVLSAFSLFNLYIAANWRSFGSAYGYRYLVFTGLPLLSIYLVTWIDHVEKKLGRGAVLAGFLAVCVVPLASVLVYARSSKYSLYVTVNSYGIDYGIETFTQPNYHRDLLADLLRHPIAMVIFAVGHNWRAGWFGGMPAEHVAQRLVLYLAPPLLFLFCYSAIRRRLMRSAPAPP